MWDFIISRRKICEQNHKEWEDEITHFEGFNIVCKVV